MVTLTESYFSVDMELNAAHIHYTNVACGMWHVAPLEKANTLMQAFRKFQLKVKIHCFNQCLP